MSETPTDIDLLRMQLALWKGIAAARERRAKWLGDYGDLAVDIAAYWRTFAPDDATLPTALSQRVDEFSST